MNIIRQKKEQNKEEENEMTSVEYCSQCPECQSKIILDYGKGEYVCHKCGCVVMEQVDYYG